MDYIDWFSNIESDLLFYSKPRLIILNIFMYNNSICYISVLCIYLHVGYIILCICLHVAPFSSCPQSFPASGSFPVSWLFESHGQSIGASASVPNEYSGLISFRIDWFDLLAVQGTLKSSPAPQFKNINSSVLSLLHGPSLTSAHDYWKYHSFEYMELC